LRTGALSFGVMFSSLVDSSFKVVARGTDSVVSVGRSGNHQMRYAVFYTAFLKRRDYQKRQGWQDVVAPSIGLVVDEDLGKNFLVGASIDLARALFVNIGAHIGRVPTIDTNSGLTVGSRIDKSPVPTTDQWSVRLYIGGSVDLRAGAALLKSVFGGTSGSQ
jgi:hypothetical protein